MVKGLSERAYAAHRKKLGLPGGTRTAVTQALRDGRVSKNADGKIDPKIADAQWEAHTSEAKRPTPVEPESPHRDGAVPSPSTYAEARAVREAINARLSKLEYDEKMGRLVRADEVRKEAFRRWRVTRDRLLAVPARVAPTLAGADIKTIQAKLHEAFVEALEELGDE